MSGWIKLEKDLANDPRVLKMASRLSNVDVTLASRSRLVVLGALVTLWWYADTHVGDDDVLAIGPDEVDQLVGLKGFCELMPQDWLQVLDADHVKLVDYVAHNGSLAKNKALAQKRQQRHREKPTSTSRSRHAPVTQGALPDKTETRQRQEEEAAPAAVVLHESLPSEEWEQWLAHRRKKRWPVDPLTLAKQLEVLRPYDTPTQRQIINTSINAGWQGLFAPKPNGSAGKVVLPANDDATWSKLKSRAKRTGFRDPWPVDSPSSYETALRAHERDHRT
jgi:hypothetical protein